MLDTYRLRLLKADHAPAVLAFERANRAYFAASVPDRGDAYFAHFDARHHGLLADQEAGICYFHVLLGPDGAVVGRFNLVDVAEGEAELGYRVAEAVAGRGLATATVQGLCRLAAAKYGLTALRARTTVGNAASRAVLARAGFVPTGEAAPDGDLPTLTFRLDLEAAAGRRPGDQAP
ncbi:GNAT family N-acetyltransferase [Kitasatospora sp. NPDC096147]|uniref:GNAT family N-acetyltransferase n=1 Tax=Kitasatospora sp. NPDC096147 TaxID=3364093 RepID=UPI00381053F1